MKFQCRCTRFTRLWRSALFAVTLAALATALFAAAADIPPVASRGDRTAIVLDFASPVSRSFLNALSDEIRLPSRGIVPASSVWILRRDFLAGEEYPHILQVELRGNCAATELPNHASPGPLGWVFGQGGAIGSVAFVDCDRVAATLSSLTNSMPASQRQQLLARAVARVMIHELAHIETQSAAHVPHSLRQPTLSAGELIAQKLPDGF